MDITMPQLGETVTEGTITRWLKQVGDRVETDEPLFEVSTDKVDSEVPAPMGGYVTEILVQEGDTAEVGTRLAVLSDQPAGPGPSAPAPAAEAVPTPAAAEYAPPPSPPPPAAEYAPPPAAEYAPPPPPPSDAYEATAASPGPAAAPEAALGAAATGDAGAAPLLSPVVRRLISEHGLDPTDIQGTGEGGRITRGDVLEAAARERAAPAAAVPPPLPPPEAAEYTPPSPAVPTAEVPAAPPPGPPAPAETAAMASAPPLVPEVSAPARPVGDEIVPFDNIRRRTAEHMVRSKATSPHVYTSIEVDYERVERARRANAAEWKAREGFSLTYLPFVVRAFCDTVDDYPDVNASVDGDRLVVHHDVHVAIAVDLNFQGLIAPVIRNADGKRLRVIAREIHDLATRARNKQLLPDEIMGGTFTITNPGPFGTFLTLPIINQPQVAILSTDAVRKRPWVVTGPEGEDSLAIRRVGNLTLTWDHRALDGAYAAAFLETIKVVLETRDWEAELG